MAPKVGYWKIRGLSTPIYMLLHYCGVDVEEKRYDFGPNFEKTEWLSEKNKLGMKLPNLPYYIHDDVKITQVLFFL